MQFSYYMSSLKSSMLSGCYLHCLDKIEPLRLTLYTIRANIFRTRKNFPVSNADALTKYLALWASTPSWESLVYHARQYFLLSFPLGSTFSFIFFYRCLIPLPSYLQAWFCINLISAGAFFFCSSIAMNLNVKDFKALFIWHIKLQHFEQTDIRTKSEWQTHKIPTVKIILSELCAGHLPWNI